MKAVLLSIITSLLILNVSFAKSEYMQGSKPADIRIQSDANADRSKLIVTQPKAKAATVKTKPYVKNDKYVVTYESSIGGESIQTVPTTQENKSTVVHQEVKTAFGNAYVPVQVPTNNQYYRPMRGKSTYRIVTRQSE